MVIQLLRSARGNQPASRAGIARQIAPTTGPLNQLSGHEALVLADKENICYGAHDLGFRLMIERLGEVLRRSAARCDLHAFFSRQPGDERHCQYLRACGWIPHPRDITVVRTHRGWQRLTNCDNDILFAAGSLAHQCNPDVVVLASGDGNLVCDAAHHLTRMARSVRVLTLSLAGSTSYRLDAARNPDIDANIEIGLDCLDPHGVDRVCSRNAHDNAVTSISSLS